MEPVKGYLRYLGPEAEFGWVDTDEHRGIFCHRNQLGYFRDIQGRQVWTRSPEDLSVGMTVWVWPEVVERINKHKEKEISVRALKWTSLEVA